MAKTKKPKKEKKKPPFKTWLISGLRKLCQRWPPYYETLNRVSSYVTIYDVQPNEDGTYSCAFEEGWGITANHKPKLGRRKVLRCEECDTVYLVKDKYKLKNGKTKMCKTVAVDHTIPLVGEDGFTSWDEYITRLFLEDQAGFKALCRTCHATKTNSETKQRVAKRKEKKGNDKGNRVSNGGGRESKRNSGGKQRSGKKCCRSPR